MYHWGVQNLMFSMGWKETETNDFNGDKWYKWSFHIYSTDFMDCHMWQSKFLLNYFLLKTVYVINVYVMYSIIFILCRWEDRLWVGWRGPEVCQNTKIRIVTSFILSTLSGNVILLIRIVQCRFYFNRVMGWKCLVWLTTNFSFILEL